MRFKLKRFRYWVFLLAISLSASFCQKKSENPEEPQMQVAYNPQIRAIMTDYCTSCHSGVSASAGLRLDTYESVRAATETGSLLNRINNGAAPMPPGGLMDNEERTLIQNWSKNNYPRN